MIIKKTKKAFSMITAIFVIVIMAVITSLIMNVTGKTIKATTALYQKEQATLLARSYTELAILYALHYDRNSTNSCLETITDHFGEAGNNGYDIEIQLQYIGNANLLNGCNKTIEILKEEVTGFDRTISLVIDTYIYYKDFDDPADRNITFHRRTLQKL